MNDLAVSVVIPCYNCADTIRRAVRSVALQSARPAEVILVDDGSTDGTPAMLRALAREFAAGWIKVVPLRSNQGQAAARNAGWAAAGGKYIAFLDADDAWHVRKLEIQYGWMTNNPGVSLTGHRTMRVAEGTPIDGQLAADWRVCKITPLEMLLSNRIHMRSAMLLKDLPYRFDPGMRPGEDYLLWLEIVLSGHDVRLLELPLGYYYKRLYGESGVSGKMAAMEAGELKAYWRVCRMGLLNKAALSGLWAFSLAKFFMRFIVRR